MIDKNKNIATIVILFVVFVILFLISHLEYRIKTPVLLQRNLGKMQSTCLIKYNSLQFDEAAECYKLLMSLDDSPEVVYNAAISLGYAKELDESVSMLQSLRNRKDLDIEFRKNVEYAYIEFSEHKSKSDLFKKSDKGNYYSDLKRIARWKNPRNIKVYIYDDHGKKDNIKNAFLKWDSMLRSTIDFVFVNNPKDADITAKAVDIGYFDNEKAGETILRFIKYKNKNNNLRKNILKADIKISYRNALYKPWSDSEFQAITLHEIGHALGIIDHSKHKGDVMYYDTSSYQKGAISNRDVNTVKMLYGNIAN